MERELQNLIDKAMLGDVEAMVMVGKHYKNGVLTERNDVKAVEFLLMAANKGHAGASFAVGMEYLMGGEIEVNKTLALTYLQSAADKDVAQAQFTLAVLYDSCSREEKTHLKGHSSFFYLEKAAKLGHAGAQNMLGDNYLRGEGVECDINKALFWLCCAYLHNENASNESDRQASEYARNRINALLKARTSYDLSKAQIEDVLSMIRNQHPQYM